MSERKRRASCPEYVQEKSLEERLRPNVSRPNKSYTNILVEILSESENQKLFLSEIYDEMTKKHPFFATNGSTWKNSVRHNLSQNPVFVKIPTAGRCNMWGLAKEFNYRFINGRLANVNKVNSTPKRKFTLPEVRNLIEITSNPKLILPRLNRPIPECFYSYPLQHENGLEAPPWIDTFSDDSSFTPNISDFPTKVEMLRKIDQESDFTPPTLLPKVPIYPFFSQSQSSIDGHPSQPSNCKKKLCRNRDPLLSNSLYSENQSNH